MLKFIQKLFDKNKPYKIAETLEYGFLSVGDGHEIYYEISGNKKGVPVVILHGGPGGSLSQNKRALFNPKEYFIIQFDQRGCGKSTPSLSLENNNTSALIEDMEKLRKHLDVDKWVVTGGSWGSALALAYSTKYKNRVLGLLLNSVFLAGKEEMDSVYNNAGPASSIYPDQYAKFIEPLNEEERKDPLQSYANKMEKAEGLEKEFLSRSFVRWECLLLGLNPNFESVDEFVSSEEFESSFAIFELHYFKNNCFLDSEKLIEDVKSLKEIPAYIVNGRYDLLCNPKYSYQLHQNMTGSKLVFTFDGHLIKSYAAKRQVVAFSNELLQILKGEK